jgi:hypothetical protein
VKPHERAVFEWLQREHGYCADDITFQYAGNPDFLTVDGKGWEAAPPGSAALSQQRKRPPRERWSSSSRRQALYAISNLRHSK